jgi:hypothetical protein
VFNNIELDITVAGEDLSLPGGVVRHLSVKSLLWVLYKEGKTAREECEHHLLQGIDRQGTKIMTHCVPDLYPTATLNGSQDSR